jgi:tetratricopeptide (TPR) repeat protein
MLSFDLWEKIPKLNGELDYLEFSRTLSEPEVMILSRVNGSSSLGEIVTGLRYDRDHLVRLVARLANRQALLFDDPLVASELATEIADLRVDFTGARKRTARPRVERKQTAPEAEAAEPDADRATEPAANREPAGPAAPAAAAEWTEPAPAPPVEPDKSADAAIEPAAQPPTAERYAESGEWEIDSFFSLVNRLHGERRSGILRVHRDARTCKAIYFDLGSLVNISSTPFSAAECLGRLIERAGYIDQKKVVESLVAAKGSGRRQGEELVAMGAIRRDLLGAMLSVQVEYKAAEILEWGRGFWTFEEASSLFDRVSRIETSVPRLLFNLVWKRYPAARLADQLRQRGEMYVGKTEAPIYELDEFGFGAALRKFVTIAIEKDSPLKRVLVVSNLKPEQTQRMLWALYLTGMMGFYDDSREDRGAALIVDLNNELKTVEREPYFDILHIHWTADTAMVEKSYARLSAEMEHAIATTDGLARQLKERIYDYVKTAYEALRTKEGRRAYRLRRFDEDFVIFGAEILRQKGESYLFTKEDPVQAIQEFEGAIEVNDRNGEYYAELGLALFLRDYGGRGRGVDEGRQLLRKGVAMASQSEVVHLCLAMMHRTERQYAKALSSLERVLQINPQNRFARIVANEIRSGEKSAEHEAAVKQFVERHAAVQQKKSTEAAPQ